VYCGFRPAFVMVKRTDDASTWQIYDNARDLINPVYYHLKADDSAKESDGRTSGGYVLDFLSNGFKIREDNGYTNATNGTYIFMAFSETPSNFANSR